MKKVISIIIATMLIFGCAYSQVKEPKPKIINKRIIYRDLTKPVVIRKKIPENKKADIKETLKIIEPFLYQPISKLEPIGSQKIAGIEDVKTDAIKPEFFIEFENESILRFNEDGLDQFTSLINKESHIFLVGHSHGKSRFGNLRLASKRTQIIAKKLWENGYEKVHSMAAWGNTPVGFAPNRGVLIYVVKQDKDKDPESIPIVFARGIDLKQGGEDLRTSAPTDETSADDV